MMKNKLFSLIIFFSLFFVFISHSQILEPIKWDINIDNSKYESNKTLKLIFKPTTEIGWYIYSSDNDSNSGPRTEFEFNSNKTYTLNGNVVPVNVKTKFDDAAGKGFFYVRFGEDPAKESQRIQGFISQLPEVEKFKFTLKPIQKPVTPQNPQV